MKVGELISKKVVSIEPGESIRRAAKVMAENKVGSIVILRGQELAGILTERDVLRAVANDTDLDSQKVEQVMTEEVVNAAPHWEVYEAAAEMSARNIRHLVVCEDDVVVGVVSVRDVLLSGRLLQLSNGNWAVVRHPLTFTARERRVLHRYLQSLRDDHSDDPDLTDLLGLMVGSWSFDEYDPGDDEGLNAIPEADLHALRVAVLNELPELQRAVHPAPGMRTRR